MFSFGVTARKHALFKLTWTGLVWVKYACAVYFIIKHKMTKTRVKTCVGTPEGRTTGTQQRPGLALSACEVFFHPPRLKHQMIYRNRPADRTGVQTPKRETTETPLPSQAQRLPGRCENKKNSEDFKTG